MTELDGLIETLLELTTKDERTAFLQANPLIGSVEGARRLCRRAVALGSEDLDLSELLCAVLDEVSATGSEPAIEGYRDHARACLLHRRGVDLQEGGSLWKRAIARFEAAGLTNEVAISMSCAVGTVAFNGDAKLIRLYEQSARTYFESTGDRLRLARLRSNYANHFFSKDDFKRALPLMELAYQDIVAETFGGPELANMLNNLAACYTSMGDLPRALHLLEKAKILCEERGFTSEVLNVYNNLAVARMLQGDLVSALEILGRNFELCIPNTEHYYSAVGTEAEILLNLCLGVQAQRQARVAYEGFHGLGLRRDAAKALVTLGRALALTNKPRRAVEILDEANHLFASVGSADGQRRCQVEKAKALVSSGDLDSTFRVIEALQREQSTSAASDLGCLLAEARLYFERGDWGRARTSAESALARSALEAFSREEGEALRLLGDVYETLGLNHLAAEVLSRSQRSIDRLRCSLPTDDFKSAFLSDKSGVFQSLFALTQASGNRPEHLLEIAEISKSRYLADNLLAELGDGLVAGAKAHGGRLQDLHRGLRLAVERIDQLSTGGLTPDNQDAPNARSDGSAEGTKRPLRRRARSSLIRRMEKGLPSAAEIGASLPDGSVLVEYYEARGSLFAFLLSKETLRLFELGAVAPIYRLCRLALFSLTRPCRLGSCSPQLLTYLQDLHDVLWRKVAPLSDGDRVILVPHGVLHQFPFHALNDGRRFLADKFAFSYSPSASVFYMARRRPAFSARGSVVVGLSDVGMPAIADEVRNVAELLPESRVILDRSATHETLGRELPSAKFIHVATHGGFNAVYPQFSSIKLDDGPLTVRELRQTKLSADLVVLSACETGRTVSKGCDELVGLTQALLQAGARSAVVTLWCVADQETSAFMKDFHTNLTSGCGGRDESLRQAMLTQKDRYPHPTHWAPFVLVGDPGPEAVPASTPSR